MTALLSLAVLVLIAFIGSFVYKKINVTSFWASGIVYSGIFYIILGYVIGPQILSLVTKEIFRELNVLFTLVLGWAGFLTGLQLSIKSLKRFPRLYYGEVTVNYLTVMVLLIVSLGLYNAFLVSRFFSLQDIIMFSVIGAISSPIMLGVLMKEYSVPGRLSYRLQFNSAYDNILGVLVGGLVFMAEGILLGHRNWNLQQSIGILFPYIVVGLAVFLYNFIHESMKSRQEKFLLFISLLILTIGTAYYFSQSILFCSFLFGFGLANGKISSRELYRDIQELEKPLYILLLIFAGIKLELYGDRWIFLFLTSFFVLRLFIKYFIERTTYRIFEKEESIPHSIGIAGIGMGGLSLAMALDYLITYHSGQASIFLLVIVVSLVPNDVLSIEYLKRILINKDSRTI